MKKQILLFLLLPLMLCVLTSSDLVALPINGKVYDPFEEICKDIEGKIERGDTTVFKQIDLLLRDKRSDKENMQIFRLLVRCMDEWMITRASLLVNINMISQQNIERVLSSAEYLGTDTAFETAVHFLDMRRAILSGNMLKKNFISTSTCFNILDVRDVLQSNEAWIMYHVGSERVYGLLVTKCNYKIMALCHAVDLYRVIDLYRSSTGNNVIRKKRYHENAYRIYQKIVKPLIPDIDEYTIIRLVPDRQIGGVAFELLLKRPEENWDYNYRSLEGYLIREHKLSMHHSFDGLFAKRKNEPSTYKNARILAIVPVFEQDMAEVIKKKYGLDSISILKKGPSLFRKIKRYGFKVRMLKKQNATKSKLNYHLENDELYNIIHLFTHNIYDTDVPLRSQLLVAPYDDTGRQAMLSYEELLTWADSAQVDQIILSACQVRSGDVMLSDDFVGVEHAFWNIKSSVIYSLWPVEESGSIKLFEFYYGFLKKGKTSREALRLAKLEMLEDDELNDPFYWAGYVLIDDNSY